MVGEDLPQLPPLEDILRAVAGNPVQEKKPKKTSPKDPVSTSLCCPVLRERLKMLKKDGRGEIDLTPTGVVCEFYDSGEGDFYLFDKLVKRPGICKGLRKKTSSRMEIPDKACVYSRLVQSRFANPPETPGYELTRKKCPILTRENEDGEIHLISKPSESGLPIIGGVVCEYHEECRGEDPKNFNSAYSVCRLTLKRSQGSINEACQYSGLLSQSALANKIDQEKRASRKQRRQGW